MYFTLFICNIVAFLVWEYFNNNIYTFHLKHPRGCLILDLLKIQTL